MKWRKLPLVFVHVVLFEVGLVLLISGVLYLLMVKFPNAELAQTYGDSGIATWFILAFLFLWAVPIIGGFTAGALGFSLLILELVKRVLDWSRQPKSDSANAMQQGGT